MKLRSLYKNTHINYVHRDLILKELYVYSSSNNKIKIAKFFLDLTIQVVLPQILRKVPCFMTYLKKDRETEASNMPLINYTSKN